MGYDMDASDAIPAGKTLHTEERAARRRIVLAQTLPYPLVQFLLSSVIKIKVNEFIFPHRFSRFRGPLLELRSKCEFSLGLLEPDELNERSIPPDQCEMNAHSVQFLSEGLQARKSAGRNAPLKAVPAGLEPRVHFRVGMAAASPLDQEAELPADLTFCVNKLDELRGEIDQWRQSQFDLFAGQLAKLEGLQAELVASRSFCANACTAHVNPAANLLAVMTIAWPDLACSDLICQGARPLGPQPSFWICSSKAHPRNF